MRHPAPPYDTYLFCDNRSHPQLVLYQLLQMLDIIHAHVFQFPNSLPLLDKALSEKTGESKY